MAKILYACSRSKPFAPSDETKLRVICRRLTPDNLSAPASGRVIVRGALAYAITDELHPIIEDDSILLGCLYGDGRGWQEPARHYPDGSYAIFRHAEDCLEVLSDAAGSITVWYYFDGERFLASTSQRAIVMFLGSLNFNPQVIPWMLSTGTLGPEASWDDRIRRLPPDSSVLLDKRRWSISVSTRPVVFCAKSRSDAEHRALLENDIREIVQSLKRSGHLSFEHYLLPLSGGFDSRALLCFLAEGGTPPSLRAITWGLKENINRRGNDAAVARELARKIGVEHRYFHTDCTPQPIEKVVDRFIACGEGRVDHLSAYMDGLETWRKLREDQRCRGIIRGDEGFGWMRVSSELSVRLTLAIGTCADYRNLQSLPKRYGLPEQKLPASLCRQRGESLAAWRDRLYHAYRVPTILAALSDIKLSFVGVINPLLARAVLQRVRELPDRLRTEKRLFREIVKSVSPEVPYASEGANASPGGLLRRRDMVALMRQQFQSDSARRIFGEPFLRHVAQGLEERKSAARAGGRAGRSLRALMPHSLKMWIQDRFAKPSVDPNVLAFRVFLVARTHDLLKADLAEAEGQASQAPAHPPVAKLGKAPVVCV